MPTYKTRWILLHDDIKHLPGSYEHELPEGIASEIMSRSFVLYPVESSSGGGGDNALINLDPGTPDSNPLIDLPDLEGV